MYMYAQKVCQSNYITQSKNYSTDTSEEGKNAKINFCPGHRT